MKKYLFIAFLLPFTFVLGDFKDDHQEELTQLKSLIALYPDFPKPGILFEDFIPILCDQKAFGVCIDLLAEYCADKPIEAVAGLESRGFIIGSALAYKLGVAFIPLRKPGKLPGEFFSVNYGKEYGTDALCIKKDSLKPGQKVLIVDDLIATGGSANAAIKLVTLAGGVPVEFISLLEVKGLNGRDKLSIPSFNLFD